MKICSIIGLIALSILMGPVGAMAATTTVIDDTRDGANTYYGGAVTGYAFSNQDAIPGSTTGWDINRMEVTDTGTRIQVRIIGPWLSGVEAGDPRTPGYVGNLFYNSGDLYLSSTGWKHTNDSPHFPTDTFTNTEGWNYVVTNRKIPGGVYGYESGVYALDFNSITMTKPTDSLSQGRLNQAYYGGYGAKVEGADVTFGGIGDESYILYEFDKFLSGDVGLHWTMYCGNDVVEGQVTLVPEPGSLFLLGLSLTGLCVYRRRTVREIA